MPEAGIEVKRSPISDMLGLSLFDSNIMFLTSHYNNSKLLGTYIYTETIDMIARPK